jgi:hypothetical protein
LCSIENATVSELKRTDNKASFFSLTNTGRFLFHLFTFLVCAREKIRSVASGPLGRVYAIGSAFTTILSIISILAGLIDTNRISHGIEGEEMVRLSGSLLRKVSEHGNDQKDCYSLDCCDRRPECRFGDGWLRGAGIGL